MAQAMQGITNVAPNKRLYNMLSGGPYWEFKAAKRTPGAVTPSVIN